jgi:hypothetical protein
MAFLFDMSRLYVYLDWFVNSKKLTNSTCQEPKTALTALFGRTLRFDLFWLLLDGKQIKLLRLLPLVVGIRGRLGL